MRGVELRGLGWAMRPLELCAELHIEPLSALMWFDTKSETGRALLLFPDEDSASWAASLLDCYPAGPAGPDGALPFLLEARVVDARLWLEHAVAAMHWHLPFSPPTSVSPSPPASELDLDLGHGHTLPPDLDLGAAAWQPVRTKPPPSRPARPDLVEEGWPAPHMPEAAAVWLGYVDIDAPREAVLRLASRYGRVRSLVCQPMRERNVDGRVYAWAVVGYDSPREAALAARDLDLAQIRGVSARGLKARPFRREYQS
jgi:hypothetical protein